jgi:hypothetical protein
MEHDLYAILQRDVIHDYARSVEHLCTKLGRNALLFYQQKDTRRHVWMMNRWSVTTALLKMMTVVLPLRDAVRGYLKLRDPAWFIHPVLCVYVPILYTFLYARWRVQGKGRTGDSATR